VIYITLATPNILGQQELDVWPHVCLSSPSGGSEGWLTQHNRACTKVQTVKLP